MRVGVLASGEGTNLQALLDRVHGREAEIVGVTVHYVEPGAVDSGPILLQGSVALPDATDPAEVLAALRPLEHELLPRAVALIAAGAVGRDAVNPRRMVIDEAALAPAAASRAAGSS